MRWLTASLVLATGGCAGVFGLHDRPTADDDAGIDAPSGPAVAGTLTAISVPNDSSGVPTVVTVPLTGSDVMVTVQPAGLGAQIAQVGADGTFRVPLAQFGDAYTADLRLFGADPSVLLSSSSPTLSFDDRLLGRRDGKPVTAAIPLVIDTSMTSYTFKAGDTTQIESTGVWARGAPTSGAAKTFTTDWATATSIGGPLDEVDPGKNDRLFFAVLQPDNGPNSYVALDRIAETGAVRLTSGAGPVTWQLAMTDLAPLSRDTCIAVDAALADLTDAVTSFYGLPVGDVAFFIHASPLPAARGLDVASQHFMTSGTATIMNVSQQIHVVNPFAGTSLGLIVSVSTTFVLASHGAMVVLGDNVAVFAPATPCGMVPPPIGADLPLPGPALLDGAAITIDGTQLALDPAIDHDVSWQTMNNAAADSFVVDVFELESQTGGLALQPALRVLTTTGHATIPGGTFQHGRSYTVRVVANRGTPGEAKGDYVTLAPTLSTAASFTHSFDIH